MPDKLVDVSHPSRDDELSIALVAAQPVWDIGRRVVGILRVDLFVADAALHCCFPFFSLGLDCSSDVASCPIVEHHCDSRLVRQQSGSEEAKQRQRSHGMPEPMKLVDDRLQTICIAIKQHRCAFEAELQQPIGKADCKRAAADVLSGSYPRHEVGIEHWVHSGFSFLIVVDKRIITKSENLLTDNFRHFAA